MGKPPQDPLVRALEALVATLPTKDAARAWYERCVASWGGRAVEETFNDGAMRQVVRRGDTAVARTTLGPAFEGAPGRAHGGVVGAILDETMGYLLPIIAEMAYTANLSIDYIAPAPLGVEVTFTARLRDRSDRKLWIEAVGESADGVFVRAEALFLTVDLSRFTNTNTNGNATTPTAAADLQ